MRVQIHWNHQKRDLTEVMACAKTQALNVAFDVFLHSRLLKISLEIVGLLVALFLESHLGEHLQLRLARLQM